MRMMRKSGSSLTANHSRLTTARVIWAKRAASRKRRRQHTSTSQAQSPLPYISSVKESQPESRQKQTTLSSLCHSHKPNSETNAHQRVNADNADEQCRPPFTKTQCKQCKTDKKIKPSGDSLHLSSYLPPSGVTTLVDAHTGHLEKSEPPNSR